MTVIKEMHRDSNSLYGDGMYALVKLSDESTLHLSRLDGENYWVADGLFLANGSPSWCHGFGSRCTTLRAVSEPALKAALDAAADLAPAARTAALPIEVR